MDPPSLNENVRFGSVKEKSLSSRENIDFKNFGGSIKENKCKNMPPVPQLVLPTRSSSMKSGDTIVKGLYLLSFFEFMPTLI